MRKTAWMIAILLTISTLLLSGIWIYFQKSLEKLGLSDSAGAVYDRHYVLIPDSENSMLWESVYESASKEAEAAGAYLELIDPESGGNYTLADYLRIVIASQIDGIILTPDGTEEVRALIDTAESEGIPVITVLEDDSDSLRTSFVGLNSYQMADTYTDLCLDILGGCSAEVMILADSESRDPIQALVATQLIRTLEQKTEEGQEITVTVYYLDNTTDFEAEEGIRDLFVSAEDLPEILICMDEVTTECTYQALVDYNEVGSTDIIGFYYSDSILDAVEKEIIPVTLALDTDAIGQYCINALEEYHSLGHASNYYNVDLTIITSDNAADFATDDNESEV